MTVFVYDAFMSYSQKADGAFAQALQGALEKIATPWYRRRSIRVFRDETTLKPTPAIWSSIQDALNKSKMFILLASPEAAESDWVNKEIAHWLSRVEPDLAAPSERMLICLTEGQLKWPKDAIDFDWDVSDALPPALKRVFREQPLWVDFIWADRASALSLQHKPFYNNVARLAAAIRGMELDELIGEDIRQHRRRVAFAAAGGAVVVALSATAYRTWNQAEILTQEKLHQTDAERVLPQLNDQLKDVRTLPTRSLAIEFVPHSFFGTSSEILELRLELDPLFTVPMSFFFAKFIEGKTWPAEFGFVEPPRDEFSHGQVHVDAKLRWFDRVETLSQAVDGTDAGTTPSFSLEFDGKEFMPGSPGLHLRQSYQIPSLQDIIDKKVRFRLIAHDPVAKQAHEIDLASRSVEIRVLASHSTSGASRDLVLFDGNPTRLQKDILSGDYLVNRGAVERTVLVNLYPPVAAERDDAYAARRERVKALLETRKPESVEDRRLLARAINSAAQLSAVRGDALSALNGFIEVVRLLSPLVFDAKEGPTREDGERLYKAALQPVAYFVKIRKFDRAKQYVPNLLVIADRMIASDSTEPDYLRWRADAQLWAARVAIASEAWPDGVKSLVDYVASTREVDRRIGSVGTRKELADALHLARAMARPIPSSLQRDLNWTR